MQILIQVVCRPGPSLRDVIARDPRIEYHLLTVVSSKRQTRPHGWAKVRSTEPDRRGALNLEWDADTKVLICRVVTRGKGKPNLIIGDFIDYLLKRHSRRIEAINIIPR